jgi:dTDP-D-glucose 4,6-dehydratase
MLNILITGGCGFIGSNIINHILHTYDNIFILNIDKLNNPSNINFIKSCGCEDRYKFIPISILENDSIYSYLCEYNIDYVIHCASSSSHIDNSFNNSINFSIDNYIATHYLLEAIHKYSRISSFIYISNIELFNLDNLNPYSVTKAATELLIKSYQIPYSIIRLPTVFGSNQSPNKIIPSFIHNLLNNNKIVIYGNGSNHINLLYINDVVNAIMIILFNKLFQLISLNSSLYQFSIIDIASMLIKQIKGNDADVNEWISFTDDNKRLINDISNLEDSTDIHKLKELGWTINTNDIHLQLNTTIDFYKTLYIDK